MDSSNPELVSEFGDGLRQAGYTEAGLRGLIGTSSSFSGDTRAIEIARRRLGEGTPLKSLIQLFSLGTPGLLDEVADALGPAMPELLIRIGAVSREGRCLSPQIAIDAAGDLLVAHDRPPALGPLPADHVIGLGPAPRTLAALAVKSTGARTLDLGTGSGVHALLALRRGDSVVATDINPRALAYTEFNAALNRLPAPDTRCGDLFQPVAEEAFDLIVANPPYVLSPERSFDFRDSGLEGDELSRKVVRGAADRLKEGGFASVLVSWTHPEETNWAESLSGFVHGTGCDAVMLHFRSYDPLTYASLWIKEQPGFGDTLDRWLDYYRRLDIRSMSSGAVILRRRSGVNWVRSAQVQAAPVRNASEHLLRIFDAGDRLGRLSNSELLDQRFRPHPGHRIDRTGVSRDGGYRVDGQHLETSTGIPLRVSLGQFGSYLLAQLDGTRSLGNGLARVRQTLGMSSDESIRSGVDLVKELYALGFLELGTPGLDQLGRAAVEPSDRGEVVTAKS